MNRETSPVDDEHGLVRWRNTAPIEVLDGAHYQRNPELAERLGDVLRRVIVHIEAAAARVQQFDTREAWAWLTAWMLIGSAVESEFNIASGSLPARDGVHS